MRERGTTDNKPGEIATLRGKILDEMRQAKSQNRETDARTFFRDARNLL
jgi:hypothetical protein